MAGNLGTIRTMYIFGLDMCEVRRVSGLPASGARHGQGKTCHSDESCRPRPKFLSPQETHTKEMRKPKPPFPELGYVPQGESTKRCQTCGKDTSVEWLICAISQLFVEERYMLWRFLRQDEKLKAFRALKRKRIT